VTLTDLARWGSCGAPDGRPHPVSPGFEHQEVTVHLYEHTAVLCRSSRSSVHDGS